MGGAIESDGLYDRDSFVEAMEERILDPLHRDRPGALLLLDIDSFHIVNDSLGHEAGDRLLETVAATLREESRADDLPARICADEFGLLLPRATPAQAMATAERLIALVRERGQPGVGASVGIASFGGTGEEVSAEGLMITADIALCEAKEAGGGRAVDAASGPNLKLTWAERIREAIDQQRIVVYAQPIFDLRKECVAREELLVRMLDDNDDVIPPASFLPTAERLGLITEIDRLVLSKAIELAGRSQPIAINVSGASLSDGRLIADVRAAIADGLNPAWLDFEITETAAISNMDHARAFADAVTGMGCGLGLDDFGTGFSSFSYLKELPIQHLKIDIEFIRELPSSPTDQRLVQALVQFAKAFGQETVAEGIENAETLALVRAFDIDYAQGFHIGEPALVDGGRLAAAELS
ncbi:MAG TPA: bifunctional diguanylate cyclase/phosphodiesterase [Solirubrobacterales bacterium]|nr:bifunctional diguanylate cyclase/phosphodiesterase [Solirubrobacterales bacterium]